MTVLQKLGATPPERPTETSSTRVVMFAAFAVFSVCVAFIGIMMALGIPEPVEVKDAQGLVVSVMTTWDQWEGFMEEVTKGIGIFLVPYGVGRAAGAYEKKKA